jgi:hypothetical protein
LGGSCGFWAERICGRVVHAKAPERERMKFLRERIDIKKILKC